MTVINQQGQVCGPGRRIGLTVQATKVIEGHKNFSLQHNRKGLRLASNQLPSVIDVSWLPAAAERYCISSDPRDYIFVEIPIVTADYPNRNMDAFPYSVLTEFNPTIGRLTYQTFIGKPQHQDHQNQDPTAAKGVIFDATLRPQGKMHIVRILGGFDRTKDPTLVNQILSGERDGYSMGAIVAQTQCSYCNNISDGQQLCSCILSGKGRIMNGTLVFEKCLGVNYIENSSVEDPADPRALSNLIMYN